MTSTSSQSLGLSGLVAAWMIPVGLLGCSSGPEPAEESGDAFSILVLEDGYAEVDGRRVTLQRAVWELREAVRDADAANEPRPYLEIVLGPRSKDASVVDWLRFQGDRALVNRIELTAQDG